MSGMINKKVIKVGTEAGLQKKNHIKTFNMLFLDAI